MLRLLFLGDVIGEPGRRAVIETVPLLKKERGIDFVIVNGENSAAGRGITPKISIDLLRAGVAVITTGDHIWDQKEIIPYIDTEPRLLRPINYPDKTPGQGAIILEYTQGQGRGDQRAGADLYAATSGEPVPDHRRGGDENARGNKDDFCGCPCGNHQRENRHGAFSGRQGFGSGRDAHAYPDSGRARVSGRDSVFV